MKENIKYFIIIFKICKIIRKDFKIKFKQCLNRFKTTNKLRKLVRKILRSFLLSYCNKQKK